MSIDGRTASYSCQDGHVLDGRDSRFCQQDGEWSGAPPTCVGECSCGETVFRLILSSGVQCQDPISPAGGYIEVSNFNGQYEFGSVASYRCNAGHVLWGNSSRYHAQQRNSKKL